MSQINILIKDRIATKLREITEIQSVYDKPQLELGGMPAATITPSGIEGDYNSNVHDKRTYTFKIRLFYDVDRDNTNSVGFALDALYELADLVMDKFTLDKDWSSPTSFATNLPAGYSFIGLKPVVGEWSQEGERSIIYLDIDLSIDFLIPNLNCN